jgi:5-methylthioadenosine/S-adenosylhomocysteine deaminase
MAGLVHNITDPAYEAWPQAHEVLDCLIGGGARAMGLQDELGSIAEGKLADLILIDLDTIAFTPLNDLRRQLVYCENGSSVLLTMVAGRIVAEAGRMTTVDEGSLRAEARALFAERQSALAQARDEAASLLPYYQAMYRQANATPVDMNRWVTV